MVSNSSFGILWFCHCAQTVLQISDDTMSLKSTSSINPSVNNDMNEEFELFSDMLDELEQLQARTLEEEFLDTLTFDPVVGMSSL